MAATGIDLTSLLLAARSHTNPCAILSRSKKGLKTKICAGALRSGVGVRNGDELCANGEASRITAIQRQTPLPNEVDRSLCAYVPSAVEPTSAPHSHPVEMHTPTRKLATPSPSDSDVDRCAYTYEDDFITRRKYRPRELSQNHVHHGSNLAFPRDRQREKSINPSLQGADGNRANRFGRKFEASEYRVVGVGEAWSENRYTDHRVQGVVGERCGSVGRTSFLSQEQHRNSNRSSSLPRGSTPGTRSVHDFLYREGRSREERLRAKQKERDRELTFQPNLATTKYYKGGCCGRRNVRGEAAESSVVSQDYGGGETGGDCERAPQGAVRELQRFEMLYEDSIAQRLRVEEHALKIPSACTFQPKLVANRLASRERAKCVMKTRTRRRTDETEEPANRSHSGNNDDEDKDSGRRHGPRPSQSHGDVGEAFRERGEEREGESEGNYSQSSRARSSSVGSTKERPLTYAERLHRGGEEQRQLWAKRREQQARLELEGCTFRPRLRETRLTQDKDDTQQSVGTGLAGKAGKVGKAEERRACMDEEGSVYGVHERLYRTAEEQRVRRDERMTKTKRKQTEGCTFQPSVRGLAGRRPTTPMMGPRAPASATSRLPSSEPVAAAATATATATATAIATATTKTTAGKSVYERLVEAGKEMRRRKALRDQATPPGCTFKPTVNSYKPTKHPKAWVRPPPPLPSNRDEEAPTLPVPPPFITRCVNAAPPDYVIDDSSIRNGNGTGEKKEAQIGGREKNRAAKHPQTPQTGSIHYDQLALPEECNTSDLIDANSRRALATSGGVEPCRPADNSSKVPYTYMDTNCFTPRRRRKSSSNNRRTTTTSTAISHLRTERRQEEIIGMRVENRLHELGATLQRRRNNMPKDPSVAQRERQEQKELLECTFKPMSFTKTYGKTQKRGKRVSRVSEQ